MGEQLRTVEDIMLVGNKIPFIKEKVKMKEALRVLSKKKLGFLLIINSKNETKGIITDGQIRRFNEKKENIYNMPVEKVMTKNQ